MARGDVASHAQSQANLRGISCCLGLFFCFAIFTLNCLWRIPFPNGLNVVMLNEKAQDDRIVKKPIRSGKEFTKPA